MRPILTACEIPISTGWEGTIKTIEEDIEKGIDYSLQTKELQNILSEQILVGNKAVKIFHVEEKTIDLLCRELKKYKIESSEYSNNYPLLLPQEKVEELNSSLKIVDVVNAKDELSVVFCTTRVLSRRIEISKAVNSEDILTDYRKITGRESYRQQFFDVVCLRPSQKVVEIRIDLSENMQANHREVAFSKLESTFNRLCNDLLEREGEVLSRTLNIFPVIKSLYESSEGVISDLRLKTDDGSIKHEKLSRGSKDLRDEEYHKAGINKLRAEGIGFRFYNMTVRWFFERSGKMKTYVELLLPSSSFELSSLNPELKEFIVDRCISPAEYNSILNKIFSLING